MLDISKYKPTAESPFGLAEEDFIPIEKILDEAIVVFAAATFANDKGPGVYIGFTFKGSEEKHYTTTHAVGLVKIFGSEELIADLQDGETANVRIHKRPSKTDKTKTVYDVNRNHMPGLTCTGRLQNLLLLYLYDLLLDTTRS